MQKYEIMISELAEQDLENVGDYITSVLRNRAAINTIRGIHKIVDNLQCFPERYDLDEDPVIASCGVRIARYRNYKIYYIVVDNTVFIVRIIHKLMNARERLYSTFCIKEIHSKTKYDTD